MTLTELKYALIVIKWVPVINLMICRGSSLAFHEDQSNYTAQDTDLAGAVFKNFGLIILKLRISLLSYTRIVFRIVDYLNAGNKPRQAF